MLTLISQSSPSKLIEFQTTVCACVLSLCPEWTAGGKSGRPKNGERVKSGLETAMANASGTKRTKATKRWRCMVCGKFGHGSECCWLLEKSEDTQQVVVNTCPIQAYIDDDGKEVSV